VEDLERGGVASTGEEIELHVVQPWQRHRDAELGHLAPRTPDTRAVFRKPGQLALASGTQFRRADLAVRIVP
jgi:hypothetical protein